VSDWVALFSERLPVEKAMAFVADPAAGGIATFAGTTRGEKSKDEKQLVALDYEAYEPMAKQQFADLAKRAREQWPILKLAILHRVGRVLVAEPSVVIAVSTPHRAEAFEACRWLIDTLKTEATIWKKEVFGDGSATWVGG
jgi:molybdopterin synthase catalytic subunit